MAHTQRVKRTHTMRHMHARTLGLFHKMLAGATAYCARNPSTSTEKNLMFSLRMHATSETGLVTGVPTTSHPPDVRIAHAAHVALLCDALTRTWDVAFRRHNVANLK